MDRTEMNPEGLRILVVEDEPDAALVTARLLRGEGHQVRVAGDGAAALEAVEEGDPDVVLLDLGLPGMDGYEVARRVKGRIALKTPLLIALTGLSRQADVEHSAEAGIDLHLTKPADPTLLRTLLQRFQQVVG
jgi:CheY-like chemotaxis protein